MGYIGRHEYGNQRSQSTRMAVATAAGILTTGIALVGCSRDAAPEIEYNRDAITSASPVSTEICPDGVVDMAELASNDVVSEYSFTPALSKTGDKGETVLFNENQASDIIMQYACTDPRHLAVMTAYLVETRENLRLPDEATIGRAADLAATFASDPTAAKEAVVKLSALINSYLQPTTEKDPYVTVRGQAVVIAPEREVDNKIIGIRSVDVITTGELLGYRVGFNEDDGSLTEEEKAVLRQLRNLMLLDAQGRLVINVWLGNNEVKLAVSASQSVQAEQSPSSTIIYNLQPSQSAGANQGSTGPSGSAGGASPRPSGSGGGSGGASPRPSGSGGGSASPSASASSSSPRPSSSSPRPSSSPSPSSHTPTPTPTPSSTPTPKGSEPPPDCDVNPFDPRCN